MKFSKPSSKLWKITLIVLLFVSSIVAMVFGSLNIGRNNSQKGFFGDTYSTYFDLNVSNLNNENEQEKLIQEAGKSFSNWLLYKNISNSGVKNELISNNNNITSDNFGRIYADLQNIAPVTYRGETRNKNPKLVLLESLNTSRIDIEQYSPLPTATYTSKLVQSNINSNSARNDTRTDKNSFGVLLDLNTNLNIKIFIDEAETKPAEKTEWFIFQNKDILIEKLNYAKKARIDFLNINNLSPDNQREILFTWETLPEDLKTWAEKSTGTSTINTDVITPNNLLQFYIESKSSSTSSNPNADPSLTPIVESYLLTNQETSKSITYENYNNWFPTADVIVPPTTKSASPSLLDKNAIKPNKFALSKATEIISRLSIQTYSQAEQNNFIFEMKNLVFNVPLQFSNSTSISDYKIFGNSSIIKPYLDKSIVNSLTSYQMIFISFSVILLLIGLIVCFLYRVPGLFATLSIISSVIFSSSFLILLKINFSMPSVISLLFGVLISLISVAAFMERIRRYINNNQSIFDSIKLTLKKSLLLIVDLHATTILFGLMLVFIGQTDIIDMGLTLILYSLISFLCIFLFFIFPMYLLSGYNAHSTHKPFIFIMKNSAENKMFNFNFKLGNNFLYGVVPISIIIIIIAIALSFTLGIPNSFSYNNGSTIYISNISEFQSNIILAKLPGLWTNPSFNNGLFSVSSVTNISINELNNILTGIAPNAIINIATTSPAANFDIARSTALAILAGFGLISVYYVFRLNVISVIPIFITNVVSTLVCVSFMFLTWMFIDLFFIYAVVFVALLSNAISLSFVSISKSRFVKNKVYNKIDIQKFISMNVNSTFKIYILIFVISILSFFIFYILISPLTFWLFGYLMIGSVISILLSYFCIIYMYYFFILIRQQYARHFLESIGERFSHKKIEELDEELVQGINKF